MIKNFLLMLAVPMAHALAVDPAPEHMLKDPESASIVQVAIEQADSIEYFDGEKLYLKARNIYHTNIGLALYNGYSTILLPKLSVDQGGYYLSCLDGRDNMLKCSVCGYEWSIFKHASAYCPICGGVGE